jgi:hypothetical protein
MAKTDKTTLTTQATLKINYELEIDNDWYSRHFRGSNLDELFDRAAKDLTKAGVDLDKKDAFVCLIYDSATYTDQQRRKGTVEFYSQIRAMTNTAVKKRLKQNPHYKITKEDLRKKFEQDKKDNLSRIELARKDYVKDLYRLMREEQRVRDSKYEE